MVAVDRLDAKSGFFDLWLYDLKRDTESRLTFNSKKQRWSGMVSR